MNRQIETYFKYLISIHPICEKVGVNIKIKEDEIYYKVELEDEYFNNTLFFNLSKTSLREEDMYLEHFMSKVVSKFNENLKDSLVELGLKLI